MQKLFGKVWFIEEMGMIEFEDESKQILLMALYRISKIEDELYGGDWDEIEEARQIAKDALKEYSGDRKLYLVENPVSRIVCDE